MFLFLFYNSYMNYKHKEIEKKWQKYWEDNNIFKVDLNSSKPKYYSLDMFPYPSGQGLHVGHPEGYTITDIYSRLKRMQGFEVLHPIGFDSFGLPAEQYAIKTNNSPKEFTMKNIGNFVRQLKSFGFSFNWEQTLITSEPYYYQHTQWIFAQLYKHGLAEIKAIEINWCEELNTVLSNEEVNIVDGKMFSERGDFPVVKKPMKQWVLKITKYADRLFENLDGLNWPTNIIKLQKNWIYNEGKKEKGLHLHDWIFARQRYWGEPFPIVHQENNELYLIPEQDYPIILPEIKDYTFSKDGKPSLSKATDWIQYDNHGIKGTMDLNTMPQWAASSWYYIAYILKDKDENGKDIILDLDSKEAKKRLNKWLSVDFYVGGQEHAVLHLLYARFWHLFLYDIGVVETKEPFIKLFNQGMILGTDGDKMSKSKGNTVSPDEVIETYGADALRLYEMFMGPLADAKPWSNKGIKGIRTWLDRVYNINQKLSFKKESNYEDDVKYNNFLSSFDKNINEIKFNNAISDMMVFVNYFYASKEISERNYKVFLQALSLFAPHIAEELWSKTTFTEELSFAKWPELLDIKLQVERKIVFQKNGKFIKMIIDEEFFISCDDFSSSYEELEPTLKVQFDHLIKQHRIEIEKISKIIYKKDKILNLIYK